MSIAFMLTPENLPQLKNISAILRENGDWSDEMRNSLELITNAIDVLNGSYNNVAFSSDVSFSVD
jgi:hypothetical protein